MRLADAINWMMNYDALQPDLIDVQNCKPDDPRRYDQKRKPSGVRCAHLHRTFFDCVYFMVVTIGTIGFGDMYPTSSLSRFVVVIIISFSLIVIPLQLQRLAELVLTQGNH